MKKIEWVYIVKQYQLSNNYLWEPVKVFNNYYKAIWFCNMLNKEYWNLSKEEIEMQNIDWDRLFEDSHWYEVEYYDIIQEIYDTFLFYLFIKTLWEK